MSSYVFVELDTTSPVVNIYAPPVTIVDIDNEIRFETSDKLSSFQEIYYIPQATGEQKVVVCALTEDRTEYVGNIKFFKEEIGLVTIYARVEDEVGNISSLFSKTISVKGTFDMVVTDLEDYELKPVLLDDYEKICVELSEEG